MINQNKKIPIRKCVVSGRNYPKADMVRIVSFKGADIQIDIKGKANGRGCYISPEIENIQLLLEKKGYQISRALKKKISKAELDYLEKELPKAFEEKKFRPRVSKPVTLKVSKNDFEKVTKANSL